MKRSIVAVSLLMLSLQPGCIWKLWSKGPPIEERIFDLYGTVQSIGQEELVLQTRDQQEMSFRMADYSIRGSNFGPGAYVHVYYRIREDVNVVTMVVEKID